MKCKFCGYEINETDTICPGCDRLVEDLIVNDNVSGNSTLEPIFIPAPVIIDDEPVDITDKLDEPLKPIVIKEKLGNKKTKKEKNVKEKKKDKDENVKSPRLAITVIIVIILLFVCAYLYYYLVYTKPSNIVSRMLYAITDKLPSNIDGSVSYYVDSNYSSGDSLVRFSSVNNIDTSTLNGDMSLFVYKDNSQLTSLYAIKNNDDLFLYDQNIYDGYFKTDFTKVVNYNYVKQLYFSIYRGEFKNIIANLRSSFSSYIGNGECKKEYTTVNYDEKNMAAVKLKCNLDINQSKKLVDKVTERMRSNQVVTSLSKVYNMSRESILFFINNYGEEIKNNIDNIEVVLYSDYMSRVPYSFEVRLTGNNNYKFSYDDKNIKMDINGKSITISLDMQNINVQTSDENGNKTYNYSYTYTKGATINTNNIDIYSDYNDIAGAIEANINSNNDISMLYSEYINSNLFKDKTLDTLINNINELEN